MEKVSKYFGEMSGPDEGAASSAPTSLTIGSGRVTDPPLRAGGQDEDGAIGAWDDGFGDGD